jgi:NAD(P)H dehydrogenase (quinone)
VGNTDRSLFLIAGATGKSGRYTVRLLLQQGHRVRAFVHRRDSRATRRGEERLLGDAICARAAGRRLEAYRG